MADGLLAIDVGNTSTYAGLFRGERLVASFRYATDRHDSSDTLGLTVAGLLALQGADRAEVGAVGLCSVVPLLTRRYREMIERYFAGELLVISAENAGIPVAYTPPTSVGADRLANAVAAIAQFGAPVIVADFGTAITVDVVDAEGVYAGGAIAPGVEIGLQALYSRTAQLPMVDIVEPTQAIGGTTAESIRSGLVYGTAGLADALIRRFREELGAEATVIATGGIARLLAPACTEVEHVAPDLTLTGIRLIWERQRSGAAPEV